MSPTTNSSPNLASKAQGRIISGHLDFKLTPPQGGALGDTDTAFAIGKGLIAEAMRLLKTSAEREGFEVEITYQQVVY